MKEKTMIKNLLRNASMGILILTLIAAFVIVTPAAAQELTELPTHLKLSVAPNPVGEGQTVSVNVFFSKPTPSAGVRGVGTIEAGEVYEDITVKITKPDGDEETVELAKTDQTGGTWFPFTVNQIGQYTFQAFYPGQALVAPGYEEFYMEASESEIIQLQVQEDPAGWNYNSPPTPEYYWSRPIYATNWNWDELGGNWFGLSSPAFADTGNYDATGNFQPYSKAPNSPHILWTKPTHFGGQPGGPISGDQSSQYSSTSIVQRYFEPIILNGIIYYVQYASTTSEVVGWKAVDLRTGETIWTKQTDDLLVGGQILMFHSMQEFGSVPFLYSAPGEPWIYFQPLEYIDIIDPMTGAVLAKITDTEGLGGFLSRLGVSFLIDSEGPAPGSLLAHYVDDGNLTMWNSTRLMYNPQGQPVRDLQPSGNISFVHGIEWSVPLPTELDGVPINLGISTITSDVMLLRSAPTMTRFNGAGYQITAGYDPRTGEKLWGPINQTLPMAGDVSVEGAGEGVYVIHDKDTNNAYGYSLDTGAQIWGPVELEGNAWSSIQRSAEVAYGKIYIFDFGGYVNALDLQTGDIEWTFHRGSSELDTPYGVYPFWYNSMIADGKLFLSEGSMYNPPVHPSNRVVLNCTTGEMVWSILSYSGRMPGAIADGIMIEWNSFDSQIYAYGKGPTKTTATIKKDVIPLGDGAIVSGNVLDISAGANQEGISERFPNGLPAVSDESMQEWMEFVYMQQQCPADVSGVEVTIESIDPNGNYQNYGTATTDSSGNYALMFTPEIPGTYMIRVTFEGSESYYSSTSTTYLGVQEAPSTTIIIEPEQPEPELPEVPDQPTEPNEPVETPFITTEVAVIIGAVAVAAIAAVAFVLFKRRK